MARCALILCTSRSDVCIGLLSPQAAKKMYPDDTPEEADPELTKKEFVNALLRDELVVTREPRDPDKISPVSPLGGAMLQSNQVLFQRVYNAYTQHGGRWSRQQVGVILFVETRRASLCQD